MGIRTCPPALDLRYSGLPGEAGCCCMSFCCSVLFLSLVPRRVSRFSVASEVSNALFSKFRLILVLGVDLGVIGGSAVYAVPLVE